MMTLTAKELLFLKELAVFASILNPSRSQLVITESLQAKGFASMSEGRVRVTPEGRAELDLHRAP